MTIFDGMKLWFGELIAKVLFTTTLAVVLVVLLLLTGCGKPSDPTFAPYIEAFQQAAIENGRPDLGNASVEIVFGDAGGNNAVCQKDLVHKQIVVDEAKWELMSSDESKYLLFHELGHCILNRAHQNTLWENSVPTSIMNGQVGIGNILQFIQVNPAAYEHELFHGGEFNWVPPTTN